LGPSTYYIPQSSHGLAVMHLAHTTVVLGLRPTASYWRCQEGHPVLMLTPELKSSQRHPPSPNELGKQR